MSAYSWPSPGCVGLWKFNNNGNDDSGEGNNATAVGATYDCPGRFGAYCTYLHNDRFDLIYDDSLKPTDLTIAVWFKGTDTYAISTLYATTGLYMGETSYTYYGFHLETHAGYPALRLRNTSLVGATAVNDGAWHWLVATRDNSFARVYVDGRIDAEITSPITIVYKSSDPADCFIGASWLPTNPITLGNEPICYLDELQIWNYAMTPGQIYRMYAFQLGGLV